MLRLLLRRFRNDRRGGVLVEAGIIMPLIVFVILAGVEVGRFALLQQKLTRTAVSMADLVAQAEELSTTDLNNLFQAVQFVVRPFEFGPRGLVIISSISATGNDPPVIDWQRSGAGSYSASSNLGTEGNPAILPEGFVVRSGESVIFAEVVYNFQPLLFPQLLGPQELRHRALFRPRFGALSSLQP
ncbi:MAG: TadE/TadG family type IV pilus assembly protein [Kiloniellaceae bacterium]